MDGLPPRDWWREVPCGHPHDPVAWRFPDGHWACHCGRRLDPANASPVPIEHGHREAPPGPVVYCDKCGCHVAIPLGQGGTDP